MTSNEDDTPQVIVVPKGDPLYANYIWRQDSITLTKLRPVLAQLQDIPNQPCRLGTGCPPEGLSCIPCAIRRIKAQLFGEEETSGDGPGGL
jgi:hypothetical protein